MRESNFYFPAHNKASVCITSALYDRRAIDATSPLPLLSTLTHLSYLTSTSPRIRDILCSDGGLERLITILRSTGKRMREHRDGLRTATTPSTLLPNSPTYISSPPRSILFHQSSIDRVPIISGLIVSPSPSPHSSAYPDDEDHQTCLARRLPIQASPFRSFLPAPEPPHPHQLQLDSHSPHLTPPTEHANNTNDLSPPPALQPQPPLPPHQAATIGLTKEQKQLLWTWSLSFQCVVNIGVRGTESVRTRVVEAGVVPIIISVLGGYLHEMERIRQLSEARDLARKPSSTLSNSSVLSFSNNTIDHSRLLTTSVPSTADPRHNASLGLSTAGSTDSAEQQHPSPAPMAQSRYSLPPPRPVVPPRTLEAASPLPDIPPRPTSTSSNNPTPSSSQLRLRSSPPRLSITSNRQAIFNEVQSSSHIARYFQHPSATEPSPSHHSASGPLATRRSIGPIPIHHPNELGVRTGSISPSSVSSSSSLETSSRLGSGQPTLVRTVTADSLQAVMSSVLTPAHIRPPSTNTAHDGHEERTPTTFQAQLPANDSNGSLQSSEERPDVQLTLHHRTPDVAASPPVSSEPGPSTTSHRTRRGTIKSNRPDSQLVHITSLAPAHPILTELGSDSLPTNDSTEDVPMDDVDNRHSSTDDDGTLEPSSHFANHPTPRASSLRVSSLASAHRPPHWPLQQDDVTLDTNPGAPSDDVDMEPPPFQRPNRVDHPLPTNLDPPGGPRLGLSELTPTAINTVEGGQLPRVVSDTETNIPVGTFTTRHVPPPLRLNAEGLNPPPLLPNVQIDTPDRMPTATEEDAVNVATGRPAAPSVSSPPPSQPPSTLGFRDEDVLLALQLLAYLSKYPHVRAYFHEPASRSTLELTYGSLGEATRALGRFAGRFKGERLERERAKEILSNTHPSLNRRPASAHGHEHSSSTPGAAGLHGPSLRADHQALDRHANSGSHHHAQPHRSASSLTMRERMNTGEHISAGTFEWHTALEGRAHAGSSESSRVGHALSSATLAPTTSTSDGALGRLSSAGHPAAGRELNVPHSSSYNLWPQQPPNNNNFSNRHQVFSGAVSATIPINPLASNVFSYVERFTHQRTSQDAHGPVMPSEIQYWAGVIMRNACRKDEDRGGIRQCANMQCGKWEEYPREFAKCRRCRKAKYCSKTCQSRAWQLGHRFWCCTKTDGESGATATTSAGPENGSEATREATEERRADIRRLVEGTGVGASVVDVAIERLRRREIGGAGGGIGEGRRDGSEIGSNIATPPDREPRVAIGTQVRENEGNDNDERNQLGQTEQLRMMVEGPRPGEMVGEIN